MAKVNWNTAQAELDNQENGNGSGVGFFTLKNDNDFAIVRIMHDSPDDFDICAVHSIGEGKNFRNVSCLRDPSEPIQNCPLCAAGKKVSLRMYIHLIEYVKDEQGNIKALPKVWDRHTSYARTLIQYMNDYGPLSDIVFKIVRHGKAGSTDTTYDIIYANPKVYAPEFYPKNPELFANYSVEGTAVAKKTYEEMVAIANGAPVDTKNNSSAPAAPVQPAAPTYVPGATTTPAVAPAYAPQAQVNEAPVAPAYAPQPQVAPQAEAPVRTYGNAFESAPVRPTYNTPATGAPAADGARPRRFY